MRNEKQIREMIISIANDDAQIRGVLLNGSRANPNVEPDIFQDFDIVYVVSSEAPYVNNLKWIAQFGELMIMQMPDLFGKSPEEIFNSFTYLMQFADGNRIDLTIVLDRKIHEFQEGLCEIWVDKDNNLTALASVSEAEFFPKPPTMKQFSNCCNEFWWVSTYVAKGLWREEILYVKQLKFSVLHNELMKMLNWKIGITTRFSKNPGKFGKYYQKYLSVKEWDLLQSTFSNSDINAIWDAFAVMCELFETTAKEVAAHFNYTYDNDEGENTLTHLLHVRHLPRNANEMY